MIIPHLGGEGGVVPEDQRDELSLLCLGTTLHGTAMTDTQLTVQCEGNVTCTALESNPGATIVSPILLSLSGVAGQIWALVYLYRTTRPQHSRTVFFVLLSTLIWTDLIGKIITTPPALIAYVKGGWVGGVKLCNFHGFSMMLISLVTHLLVSTMAVERFIGIRHGYFYNKNITTSRTKLLLVCIWLFSVLFCALPLFGVGQYALQYPGSWCFVNIHVCEHTPLLHRIYTNVFGCFTIISLVVMVVCNVVVITTLLCLRLCRNCCKETKFSGPLRNSKHRELEMQMVIVLLVITIVFVLSWSPIDIRLFLNQIWPHKTQEDHMKDLIAVRLTSINQIIDPWAYIICRKVFTTRVWQWIRKPLLGRSWLIRRESSSLAHLGSKRKISRTLTPGEKKIEYKTPFNGEGIVELSGGVVVVEETKGHLPPPVVPPASSEVSPGAELEVRDVEIFRDSGTGSNNTPSTFCSDSGTGNNNNNNNNTNPPYQDAVEIARLGVVPIPVFTSQQYRVAQPTDKHNRRVRRICSSASARTSSSNKPQSYSNNRNADGNPKCLSPEEISGRRHSWCCPQDALVGKHYRTQSTQTFKGDSTHLNGQPNGLDARYGLQPEIILSHDLHNAGSNQVHSPSLYTCTNESFFTPPDNYNWSHRCDYESSDQFTSQFQSDSIPDPDDDPVFVVPNSAARLKGVESERESGAIANFSIYTSTPIHKGHES